MLEYLSLLAPISVVFFFLVARRLPASPRAEYGWPDIGLVVLLFAWFGVNIVATLGKKLVINATAINLGILVNASVVLLIVGFLVFRNKNPIVLFGLNWKGWRRGLPFCLLALTILYPAIVAALWLTGKLMGGAASKQDLLEYLLTTHNWNDRAALIFYAIVVAPIMEETVFRGYLHGVLRSFAGRWVAMVVSAALFALIHAHIPSLGGLFVLAMGLTIVYERTQSLWAPMFMHATFNTVTVIVALYFPQLVK